MNKIICLAIVVLLFTSSGCKEKSKSFITNQQDTTKVFSYQELLMTDINDVRETAYYMYKITERTNQKKDSVAITLDQFNSLSNTFINKNISTEMLHANYKESTFHDLGTKSITINYSATNNQIILRDIIIMLNDQTNKLSHLYFNTIINQGDSTILERCIWNARSNFQINKIIQKKNLPDQEEKIRVVWNEKR